MKFDYVIVGNSAAGIGCAEALRELTDSTIAIISYEKYPAYSRALIPYYLSGKIDFEKMYYRKPDFYDKMNITPILGKKAVKVDFNKKEVILEDGNAVGYGKLLIATGGKPFIPPIEGLSKQENVFTFVKLDDVLAIKDLLDRESVKKVVVLGGGIIGLMAAEVLNKKGLDVTVIELADRVLAPVVDDITSNLVQELFKEKGVKIALGTTIQKVFGEDKVEKVLLSNGETLECDMLIVAVGVVPNVDLVKDTEIKINRGIVVDKYMQTSVKDVYAAGDCAEIYDFVFGDNRVLPLWPTAYVGGRIAAFNMVGIEREYTHATSMNSMHFYDMYIINAGLNVPNDSTEFEILNLFDENSKVYKKFALKDGRIAGMILVNEVERAGIYLNLMRNYVDVSPFKNKLLKSDFGFLDLPEDVKLDLLEGEIKLGVVYEL